MFLYFFFNLSKNIRFFSSSKGQGEKVDRKINQDPLFMKHDLKGALKYKGRNLDPLPTGVTDI
jgi:hypothetical protein